MEFYTMVEVLVSHNKLVQ